MQTSANFYYKGIFISCGWLLNFRRLQGQKLFSGRFINAVHLVNAPIIAEQNDLQSVLYPLLILAASSTDRETLIFFFP